MSLVAGVLSLATYLITLCPTVYVEGSGELIGATHYLGTPHPTGYPLFALIGRLFTAVLPFASVAYEVNLVSAVTGAAAAALLCWLLRSRGIGDWAALAAKVSAAQSASRSTQEERQRLTAADDKEEEEDGEESDGREGRSVYAQQGLTPRP